MARFFAALLFVAVAISTSQAQADSNHQEQDFGTCGHRLSSAECDIYSGANSASAGPATAVNMTTRPAGCYKQEAGGVTEYLFNNGTADPAVNCSAEFPCICDKLVGAFAASTVVCNSLGFIPTFTYNPFGQTQDVKVDITLGAGMTNGGPDPECEASNNRTDSSNTVIQMGDFAPDQIDSSGNFTQIPYGTVAAPKCGGILDHWKNTTDNTDKIRYMVTAVAVVTRTFRSVVQRKRKFIFSLECFMERNITETSDQNFTVVSDLITANEVDAASDSFDFAAKLKFYESGSYIAPLTSALTPSNNEKVYVQIVKGPDQALFVYSVERCYATITNDPASLIKDTFFDNQCPMDETMDFYVHSNTEKNFRFDIQAFSFTGANAGGAVYIHCDLFVCLADGGDKAAQCAQKDQTDCTPAANNRRRRDISYKSLNNGYKRETVSSSQPILLEGSQFHAPQCGEGFVYDRVAKECSRSNLIEVKGIRLASDVFKADFSNTSSKAFKDMAKEKEYLLWVLVKATGQDKTIRGIQVVRASEGSVVLDVAVKYADTVTPEQAFTTFKQLLKAPASTTRVQNVLQIKQEKIIEYVPVARQGEKADTEKLILIVVVVVLFVVVFIAGVTLFKVKQVRQQASNARPATGFENKGIDA